MPNDISNEIYNTIINDFEWSLLCSPRLHLFDKKYSKLNEILLQL